MAQEKKTKRRGSIACKSDIAKGPPLLALLQAAQSSFLGALTLICGHCKRALPPRDGETSILYRPREVLVPRPCSSGERQTTHIAEMSHAHETGKCQHCLRPQDCLQKCPGNYWWSTEALFEGD